MMELTQIVGFDAGAGTTFAALPDLIAMLKHESPGLFLRAIGLHQPRIKTAVGHIDGADACVRPLK
jgi:hypothetical protein